MKFKDIIGKFSLKERRIMAAVAAGCCALGILCIGDGPALSVGASQKELPIYCVQRDQKMVSLTFDAAWGNEDTQQLIDILGKYGVSATFFLVGDWVEKYPESVKALSDAGHEIMNHSDDHAHFNSLSAAEIAEDISACNDKIEAITGIRPRLFRPPYGEYDDHVIKAVRAMGMEPIQWDVDSLDWKDLSADEIHKRVTERVKPGSIVLFHNAAKHTPQALAGIIEELISQGYELVPVGDLLLDGEYELNHEGRMIGKE